jgi:hypothetical protein
MKQKKQFYFKLVTSNNDPIVPFYFIITPKAYFDKHSCLYDSDMPNLESKLEKHGFYRMMESIFEYSNGADYLDPQMGRQALLSLGYIENNNL